MVVLRAENDDSSCAFIKFEGSAHREAGYDFRTIQELLGYSDVRTAMIYTHVLNQRGRGVRGPVNFDSLVSD